MGPIETNTPVIQQIQTQKARRRSRSNERNSRDNNRPKSRRITRSRSGDRGSSSSSSDQDHEYENESMDEDGDDDHDDINSDDSASHSDRSSRESPSMRPTSIVRWDYRTNLIGRRVKDSKPLCCFECRYPVLLVGRLMPCKHSAFCLQCANECKNKRRHCPKCNDVINDVEKIDAKKLILCLHGTHPQEACLRGYTSEKDLQAHVQRRHEQIIPTGPTRLDSPHQLLAPAHPSATSFSSLIVDSQPPQNSQLPPPLMGFPPRNVPPLAAPPAPLFDIVYRPSNYGLPPPQPFVPAQQQYRPPPYPPNRPFY